MANPVFGGGAAGDVTGVTAINPYGQRQQFLFGGSFAPGDSYTIAVATTQGNVTLGAGNMFVNTTNNIYTSPMPTVCFTYRERVYVGIGSQFNFCDNEDPTSWEEQAPGAGFVKYLSQYGSQDSITAFGQLQGRLAVFGSQTIQMWNTDADPANFSLVQPALDNTGTQWPETVQSLGDFDCLYLDINGVKSLRAKETTLNAYVDDGVGVQIENFIIRVMQSGQVVQACGAVDPATKNYWLFLNGTIYVLSRSLGGKIQAWSTYQPTDSNGVRFTPQKFVAFNNQLYCRSVEGGMYSFGGLNGAQYDATTATVVLPYLDDKRPDTMKESQGVQAVMSGQWQVRVSADPSQANNPAGYHLVFQGAATLNPDSTKDSTYDTGWIGYQDRGTHFSFMATTSQQGPARLSALSLHYNIAEDVG